MTQLPETWLTCSLGDVTEYGTTEKVEPNELEPDAWLLELEDIEKITSKVTERHFVSSRVPKSTKHRFEIGDVLYGKLRPYLNKVLLADASGYCTTEIIPIKPGAALDGRFLLYALRRPEFLRYVEAQSHGLNMPRLGTDAGKAAPFVLAPRNEQKRIADKLDALFGRVDRCRGLVESTLSIVRELRRAVLDAGVTGQLTAKWRSEQAGNTSGAQVVQRDAARKVKLSEQYKLLRKSATESEIDTMYLFEIPNSWVFTTWGAVSEWITYGFTKPMPHATEGVPLITARDVQKFQVDFERCKSTSRAALQSLSDKDRPLPGDLLLTKDGTIGRAALVKTAEPFCINQSVAVCWLRSTSMDKSFLELVANAGFTQRFIRDKARGMAIQHLSITDFAKCPLPVPPATEQIEISRRVTTLFDQITLLEKSAARALQVVESLAPVTLSRAFRGELVPQDPNDEPATKLLDQIQRARNTAEPGSTRKPTKRVVPQGLAITVSDTLSINVGATAMRTRTPVNRKDSTVKGQAYLQKSLRDLQGRATAQALYEFSGLDLPDFYKQLADEFEKGFIVDAGEGLLEVA